MPGCAAVGCNNRSEKGYVMKCFPRDKKLRKIWQQRVNRADWEPSNNSFLCHAHFKSNNWCITDSGKIRLQKDAIPSIFTPTSTRKSIRKRTKTLDVNNENNCKSECSTMYVKNDREHSSTGYLVEKNSSQDIDNSSVQLFAHQKMDRSSEDNLAEEIKSQQISLGQDNDLQQATVLVPEDSVKDVAKVEMQADEENEKPIDDIVSNLVDNSSKDLTKSQVKEDADQMSIRPYNYDEIEEKLKQICDGYLEENNSNNTEIPHSVSDNQTEVLQQASNKISVHRSINYKYSSNSDIGRMLTNDTEDIEIIFSAENGEEDTRARESASPDNNIVDDIEKLDSCTANVDIINNDKEVEPNINVTPNIMAAMKRKRKTRDEIMKSIEKSIRNVSSNTNSVSNSDNDLDDDDLTEVENKRRKLQNTQDDESSSDSSPAIARFTVKVTGHPDDVCDIMHNLSKNTGDTSVQEYDDARAPKEDGLVTSIITIDDCAVDTDDKDELHDDDILSTRIKGHNDWILPSTSRNSECLSTGVALYSDEELNNLNTSNSHSTPIIKNATSSNSYDLKCEYAKLQQKSAIQADVVKQLSKQLISCKHTVQELQNSNALLRKKIRNLMYTRMNDISPPNKYSQETRISLWSKLEHFDETNKQLVKDVSVKNEQMKALQSQVKQKDNVIKELQWKLNKASTYLERADKNAITYRKKLLNLQTWMRRKSVSDEKVTKFNKILLDIVKETYTGKILPMNKAIEINKACGISEYDKLLNSGFPLPALSAMRFASDNLSDSNESTNELLRTIARRNSNEVCEIRQCTENDVGEANSQPVASVSGEIVSDDTETVMGTVQDLFEESNDDDELSTNDLTEHFISQLHKFM